MRAILLAGLAIIPLTSCRCDDQLAPVVPHMRISPERVVITNAPVSQDTEIIIQVLNDAQVQLLDFNVELLAPDGSEVDPQFELRRDFDDIVPEITTEEITVVVRPLVVTPPGSTLNAKLVFTAEEAAEPASRVEVPIIVTAIDAGLPDVCNYPESVDFGLVGRNDVAREAVPLANCGVKDLIIDGARFCQTPAPGEEEDADGCAASPSIRLTTVISVNTPNVIPGGSMSLDLVFNPTEVREYEGELIIITNDPDELELRIPVTGEGAQCPTAVAEFVDDPDEFEPFDIIRLTGESSLNADGSDFVGDFEWRLLQRPIGSSAAPAPDNEPNSFIEADLAGRYVVQLEVFQSVGVDNRIRSCEPAQLTFDVVPDEELLIQLVWDHADADLDLHMLREGGQVFTHEGDVYFSNREPVAEPPWSTNPDENPNLDVDDDEGYGPENMTIVRPAPSSCWQVLVHYWNKQTDQDARTEATIRVFVYGLQTIEVARVFEEDQQLWQALEICWPDVEGDPASISQLGVVEPFPRPF